MLEEAGDDADPIFVPGRIEQDDEGAKADLRANPIDLKVMSSEYKSAAEETSTLSPQPGRSYAKLPRLDGRVLSAARATRSTIQQALRQPAGVASQLGPHVAQVSTYMAGKASSFHKKALKRNVMKVAEHSHLKLGTLASSEINVLHVCVHAMVIMFPLMQIVYGVYGSAPKGTASNQADLGDDGVWADTTVQVTILLASTLFIRRILLCTRRQLIQTEILWLAGFAWVFAALSLVSNAWNALHPANDISRELMGATNTLLAALIYFLLTHLSDFYIDLVAGWSAIGLRAASPVDDKEEKKQWRWLQYISGKRFAHAIPVVILCYTVLRLALGWRSSVVFDFLPMTNFITPARLTLVHGKSIYQPYLLLDAIVITVFDAFLLAIALYKSSCARRSFQHIFVQDFARIFTEFNVFVLHLRETVLFITFGGHIAAWLAPFDRLFSPMDWDSKSNTMRVIQMGAVQLQLGFLSCLAVWMVTAMFCALPEDSVGLRGWFTGSNIINHKRQHELIKYFLYESDVYIKTRFSNLREIDQINPTHFIMTKQIEAFNLAQLVYACGKHESSFKNAQLEIEHIQKLVSDPEFTIVEIIQDEATDTHCLILESSTMIVVAFRGTSSKKNAKTDLNATMSLHRTAKQLDFSKMASLTAIARHRKAHNTADPVTRAKRTWLHRLLCKRNSPKVHSGFYAAYLSVEKRVLTKIKQLYDRNPRKILATGHSLGGALAVLCSFDVVVQLKIANVTCTTFGCPRIGNTSFKKKFNHAVPATFAFVNASDLVTKLPPKTPKALSYTSVGTVVLINAFGNLVIAPNVLELAVLHQGYSAKAHTLKAYHLSLLLWCLRSHKMQYHPRFWRQPREFLETNYGHLSEIQEYLNAVSAVSAVPVAKDPGHGRLRRWCEARSDAGR
ncbi:Lipase domain protein [Globisporangium polare]